LRGCRAALQWAPSHTAESTITSSNFTSDILSWSKRFWRVLQRQKGQSNQSNIPSNRRGIHKIELADNKSSKFGRQRSHSFSAPSLLSSHYLSPIQSLRQAARNLILNNVLRRVTNSGSKELRRRTAQELLGGNSAPFLALVGVSLASGSGILNREDEIECMCTEVRKAARKAKHTIEERAERDENKNDPKKNWSLVDFDIGPVISKGCSAVVYAAKCIKNGFESLGNDETENGQYPLAMKMMFNFHAESNAQVILKAMQKETIIAEAIDDKVDRLKTIGDQPNLSPHPNVAKMYTAFSDYIPALSESMELYPHALPPRINPEGYGRNMSLFVIMKKYDTNLRQYLEDEGQALHWRSSLMILTQILEGLVHLSRFRVAHRDLKTDNILISKSVSKSDNGSLDVVISDFGCCWANKTYGFKCPYMTDDVDKGGNAALMAPEVANALPGLFSFIDYSKADVWATGALAYEVFGLPNPFYSDEQGNLGLDSRTFKMEDLPPLSDNVPEVIQRLIYGMLDRNSSTRLSAVEAASICQILLWAPKAWTSGSLIPSSQDILQWTMTMTTKVMYECNFSNSKSAQAEYSLILTFLSRVTIGKIRRALSWIQSE